MTIYDNTNNNSTNDKVILLGHGSKSITAKNSFIELVNAYKKHSTLISKYQLSYAFLELSQPSLEEINFQCRRKETKTKILIIPLLLFAGKHTKEDIPSIINKVSKNFPELSFYLSQAFGIHKKLAQLAHKRVCQIKSSSNDKINGINKNFLIYLGRGFREESSKKEFNKQFELFIKLSNDNKDPSQKFSKDNALTCFVDLSNPSLGDALAEAIARDAKRIVIVPHLLFFGRLLENIETQLKLVRKKNHDIRIDLAPPLGSDKLIFDIIDEKIAMHKSFNNN